MKPVGAEGSDILQFAGAPGRSWFGGALALAGASTLLLVWVGATPPFAPGRAMVILGSCAIAIGAAMLMRVEELTIDRRRRTWSRLSGWRGARRRSSGPARDLGPISVILMRRPDLVGGSVDLYSVRITGPWGSSILLRTEDRERADLLACRLARATGAEVRAVSAPSSRAWVIVPALAAAALGWVALYGPGLPRGVSEHPSAPAGRSARTLYEEFGDAMMAYDGGNPAEAEREFRRIVSARPNSAAAWNMLAYAQAAQGHMRAAIDAAETALRLVPDSPIVLDTVGEMYERSGDLKTAALYYQRALDGPETMGVVETETKYGRTLLHLGRRGEGIAMLRKAARRSDGPWSREARRLLAGILPVRGQAPR